MKQYLVLISFLLLLISCNRSLNKLTVTEAAQLNSIQSNQTIYLDEGDFIFEKGIDLKHLSNIAIVGKGKDKTRILVKEPSDPVIKLDSCNNVILKNISLGHKTESHCWGGVVHAENSQYINIDNAALFGSGIEGLTLYKVNHLNLNNSQIRDCTQTIMTVIHSNDINIIESHIFDNGNKNITQGIILHSELNIKQSAFDQNINNYLFVLDKRAFIQHRIYNTSAQLTPSKLTIENTHFSGIFYNEIDQDLSLSFPKEHYLITQKTSQAIIKNCSFDLKKYQRKKEY